ncbi:cystatin-2-like isoform X1 [Haemaphysalis longicornis]
MALSNAAVFTLAVMVFALLLGCFAEPRLGDWERQNDTSDPPYPVFTFSPVPEPPRLGGWQRQNDTSHPIYQELAHFAVAKQVQGLEFFDTVLEVTEVETQVVGGMNYRITFKTVESTCPVTETYTIELCRPKSQEVKAICTTQIYEVSWLNKTSITSYTCGNTESSST